MVMVAGSREYAVVMLTGSREPAVVMVTGSWESAVVMVKGSRESAVVMVPGSRESGECRLCVARSALCDVIRPGYSRSQYFCSEDTIGDSNYS